MVWLPGYSGIAGNYKVKEHARLATSALLFAEWERRGAPLASFLTTVWLGLRRAWQALTKYQ